MPFVSSRHDNACLYYRDYAPATRPTPFPAGHAAQQNSHALPLIFSSAWPFSSHMWDHLVLPLCESHRFRCILPDRRGYGKSEWSGSNIAKAAVVDYDVFADDLAQVVTTALPSSTEEFVGVGASLGCGEWLLALDRHHDLLMGRCKGLIFIGSSLPIPLRTLSKPHGPPREFWDKLLQDLREDCAAALEKAIPFIFRPDLGNPLSDGVKTRYIRMAEESDPIAMERTVQVFLDRDLTEVLERAGPMMQFPILILHGGRDEVNPTDEGPGLVKKHIQRTDIKIYEQGAHGLAQKHKADCLRDMVAFVDQTLSLA